MKDRFDLRVCKTVTYQSNPNRRTPMMADKLVCYMMLLCLMANNYTIIPETLAADLSLKPTK
jgi:DNA-directed RNA polymerase I subunit RPA49